MRMGPGEEAFLAELLSGLNRATRTALARSLRAGIPWTEIRENWAIAAGCFPQEMTSAQRKLALRKAQDLRKTANAKAKWAGQERLELSKACESKLAKLRDELDSLGKERAKGTPFAKPGSERALSERAAKLRQAIRAVAARRDRLAAAGRRSLELGRSGTASVCLGSRKLLGQRELLEQADSPFGSEAAWREAWDLARDGGFLLEGEAAAAGKNRHAKFGPSAGILRIRLTEAQAERRMAAKALELGVPLGDLKGKMRYSPLRMECRFLEVRLEFAGKRQTARLERLSERLEAPAKSEGSAPVGWRIRTEVRDGKRVFFARAEWREAEPAARDLGLGALGADINAWGIAWAAAKADGNLAVSRRKEGPPHFGSIRMDWREASETKAAHAARVAAKALVALAKGRMLPIVLEDLDFSAKRRSLRYEEGVRAKGLSGFAYRKLIEAIRARAAKEGVIVRFADPSWTSAAGFAKYGRRNGLNPDQAAALAIARKALGLRGAKARSVRRGGEKIMVFDRTERIPNLRISASAPRSRGQGSEPERVLSSLLGRDRREWGARLKGLGSPPGARAPASSPEGVPPSPGSSGSEGRGRAARGASRPRTDPSVGKFSTDEVLG